MLHEVGLGVVVAAMLLALISLITQGPIPVWQAELKPDSLRQSALATVITSVIGGIGFTLLVLVIPFVDLQAPQKMSGTLAGMMLGAALLYAVANLVIFYAAPIVGSTRFGMIFTLRVVPIAGLSALLVGETFTFLKLTGVITVIEGIWYALKVKQETDQSQRREEYTPTQKQRALLGVFAATVMFGSANALDAKIVSMYSAASYLPIRLLLPALLIIVGLLLGGTKLREVKLFLNPTRYRYLLLVAGAVALSASTLLLAIELLHYPTALVAMHQLSLFVTIWYGAYLTKGQSGRVKDYLVPAALCCGGVALALLG